jgi:hypothetical protein
LTWLSGGLLERWQPIATALRLIWRAGPVTMGVYVLAFGVLAVAADWLFVGVNRLLGPHDLGWWRAWGDPLGLLFDVVVFPLQVCLVAAAFDRCLRAAELADGGEPVIAPEADTAGRTRR